MTPKGWPHPKGRQRRRNTVEVSPPNQAREEEPRLKEQYRPVRRQDSSADQRKPKPTASAWGSDTPRRPKANPSKGGKATSRSCTEEEHRPDLRQVAEHKDKEHHRTQESRGTAVPRGQANKDLMKNQGNNLHSEATEGGQPRINRNHLKPSVNTGSEREEPKAISMKIAGAWTTKRPEPPSEPQDKGRGVPPKEGRNLGTDAAY